MRLLREFVLERGTGAGSEAGGTQTLEVGGMRKPARDARKWLVTEQETQKYCTVASRK